MPAATRHADLDDPRDDAWALLGNSRHGPPPGLVAIVPLLNLSEASGPCVAPFEARTPQLRLGCPPADTLPHVARPRLLSRTEFLLGSHVKGEKREGVDWWVRAQAAGDPQVTALELAPTADEGTAILFDLRVRHRGGANRSPAPRPILYVGYTARWFRDAVNFKDAHTPSWDALGSNTRRALLARIDSRAYVRRLEAELEARGVDVAALSSSRAGEYTARELVV